MCGICGQYNFRDQSPVLPETLQRMTKTIVHRGPDDEGYFMSGPLGFGFRRLSIIDLAQGHQPMADQQRSVWVIFNGEIYNFPELKGELEGYGHVFRTRCDTEVIIHGYKQWGDNVFNHLHGMFGLAIWDERKKRLIIARDAMGIKPVYYRIEAGRVYFGSEIRAVLAAATGKPEVDPVSLNLFLRYRYTPSPLTLFRGIKKLAAGTMAVFENGTSRLERWYRFKPVQFSREKTDGEVKEELLQLYKMAVKRHLLSDVPVGLLLSGGVDSGLLLGLMNQYGNTWPTFTVGYGQKNYKGDELQEATETAAIFSSHHAQIEISREEFEASLPKIISCLEEPIASSSIVPMYHVCQRARQDVKVALIGQGPDELFGGYVRHLGVRYGAWWRKVPRRVKTGINAVINVLPRNESLKRAAYALDVGERMRRYEHVFSLMPGERVDSLFHEDSLPADMDDRIFACWNGLGDLLEHTDDLGGLQFLEIRSSLPDELLMFADKLSMAHGLEVRVPYLDREIVEYVERLPARFKVRHGMRKWLHKQVCNDFLPLEIIRRKKRGFAVNVVDEWLRHSAGAQMNDMLHDGGACLTQYLRPKEVQRLFEEHRSGKSDNHKILFSLVVFEGWLRSL